MQLFKTACAYLTLEKCNLPCFIGRKIIILYIVIIIALYYLTSILGTALGHKPPMLIKISNFL